jgi:hypothetical protein
MSRRQFREYRNYTYACRFDSVAYMAPEQFDDAHQVEVTADRSARHRRSDLSNPLEKPSSLMTLSRAGPIRGATATLTQLLFNHPNDAYLHVKLIPEFKRGTLLAIQGAGIP